MPLFGARRQPVVIAGTGDIQQAIHPLVALLKKRVAIEDKNFAELEKRLEKLEARPVLEGPDEILKAIEALGVTVPPDLTPQVKELATGAKAIGRRLDGLVPELTQAYHDEIRALRVEPPPDLSPEVGKLWVELRLQTNRLTALESGLREAYHAEMLFFLAALEERLTPWYVRLGRWVRAKYNALRGRIQCRR